MSCSLCAEWSDEGERINPPLPEGSRRHHLIFHNECAVHANDQSSTAWLFMYDVALQEKSRGRITHFSDFVIESSETGRLALSAQQLEVLKSGQSTPTLAHTNARTIIEPGTKGDEWWDTAQLIEQVRSFSLQSPFITKADPTFADSGKGYSGLRVPFPR